MAVKLPCSMCFTTNKRYVLLSASETETVEENFMDCLDPSIKIVHFLNEADECSFCYRCFDSSIRFKKLKERVSKLQKQISIWSSVISKQILSSRKECDREEATDLQATIPTGYPSDDDDERLYTTTTTRSQFDSGVGKRIKIEASSDWDTDDTTMEELQRKAETKNTNGNSKSDSPNNSVIPTACVFDSVNNISVFQVDSQNENSDTVIATPNFEQIFGICPKIETTFPNVCEEDDYLQSTISICTADCTADAASIVTLPSTEEVVASPVIKNKLKANKTGRSTKRKVSERESIVPSEGGILERKQKNWDKNKRQRTANDKVNQPRVYNKDSKRSRPFKCSFCNQAFHTQSGSTIHERIHTGVKPFKCSFCEREFNVKCNLKVHLRLHTGDRPFKCSFCEKSFTQMGSFRDHERRHTGEKPYKCTFCQMTFNDSKQLKIHKLTHSE